MNQLVSNLSQLTIISPFSTWGSSALLTRTLSWSTCHHRQLLQPTSWLTIQWLVAPGWVELFGPIWCFSLNSINQTVCECMQRKTDSGFFPVKVSSGDDWLLSGWPDAMHWRLAQALPQCSSACPASCSGEVQGFQVSKLKMTQNWKLDSYTPLQNSQISSRFMEVSLIDAPTKLLLNWLPSLLYM